MSEYELTSLVFELFRDMDSMIEFWIQATFAVVVAVFVAGNRLSQWMRRVIATLYLLASVIAALRWSVLGYRTSLYRERLLESGYRDIATSPIAISVVTALIALMFLIAVSSTIRLLQRPGLGRAEARAE
jgi:hypothetical protein